VGGISIVYELKSGGEHEDGFFGEKALHCINNDSPYKSIELRDNEYITMIYGTGSDFIKTLVIKTNFYRTVKMGSKEDKKSSERPGLAKMQKSSSD